MSRWAGWAILLIAVSQAFGRPEGPQEGFPGDVKDVLEQARQQTAADQLKLPVLITLELLTPEAVCKHAKARKPEKKFAIVAVKNHACDDDAKVCLMTTRDLSHPCNGFVQNNFWVYHTRPTIYKREGEKIRFAGEQDGNDEIMKVWGAVGPKVVVIDLSDCERLKNLTVDDLPATGPPLDGISKGKNLPIADRFARMRRQLLAVKLGERTLQKAMSVSDDPAAERGCLGRLSDVTPDQVLDRLNAP